MSGCFLAGFGAGAGAGVFCRCVGAFSGCFGLEEEVAAGAAGFGLGGSGQSLPSGSACRVRSRTGVGSSVSGMLPAALP